MNSNVTLTVLNRWTKDFKGQNSKVKGQIKVRQ